MVVTTRPASTSGNGHNTLLVSAAQAMSVPVAPAAATDGRVSKITLASAASESSNAKRTSVRSR